MAKSDSFTDSKDNDDAGDLLPKMRGRQVFAAFMDIQVYLLHVYTPRQ